MVMVGMGRREQWLWRYGEEGARAMVGMGGGSLVYKYKRWGGLRVTVYGYEYDGDWKRIVLPALCNNP